MERFDPLTARLPVPAPGIALIAAERRRQVDEEGWTPEHDDSHKRGQLADAAACYAKVDPLGVGWEYPFEPASFKRSPRGSEFRSPEGRAERIRDLVKAGALLAAEIDRLQRVSELSDVEREAYDSAAGKLGPHRDQLALLALFKAGLACARGPVTVTDDQTGEHDDEATSVIESSKDQQ